MPRTKPHCRGGMMRVKVWPVLEQAVEAGINYGWNRAHKHTGTPTEMAIKREIHDAVMNEISEAFTFDEEV